MTAKLRHPYTTIPGMLCCGAKGGEVHGPNYNSFDKKRYANHNPHEIREHDGDANDWRQQKAENDHFDTCWQNDIH